MTAKARKLFDNFVQKIEERDLRSVGTCMCGRPRDRFLSADVRELLDSLVESVLSEDLEEVAAKAIEKLNELGDVPTNPRMSRISIVEPD